ncbi:hypothetical protein K458DRAFT_419261 [Lentithecium fluviatile CBS 122367]|uniref:F-box domain-containing protein n=1 Tax=Lentithecium fluviatile CBS 122367 TaxID=1168545 RepID=A0A6G1IY35_9PLEO|nr:hypothetical protein K458DRAFT_419261 [Lentithecium fluviatile CBS 122367]
MNTLPEEVLDQIVYKVSTSHSPFFTRPDTLALSALCRTSRKLHRIATPYLYAQVHSLSGTMGRRLLRTLLEQPDLAAHVKYFAVQHTNEGCFVPVESSIEKEDTYGTVTDDCSALLLQTLCVLHELDELDLSRFTVRPYSSSEWLLPLTKVMGKQQQQPSTSSLPHLFTKLRHLSVHLSAAPVCSLIPFLRLSSLRSLEVDVRRPRPNHEIPRAETNASYHITSLSIIGFDDHSLTLVSWLSARCSALQNLLVTTDINNTKIIGRIFGRHIGSGSLETIQVVIVGLWYYDVQVESARISDEARGDELFNALVYATMADEAVCGRVEMPVESRSVRSVTMRELTEVEKKTYDGRFPRRP